MPRDIEKSGTVRERITTDTESGIDTANTSRIRKPLAFHLTQDPISGEVTPCLSSGNPVNGQCSCGVIYTLDRAAFNQGKNAQYDFEISDKGISPTIVAKGPSAVYHDVDFRNGKLNDTATPLQARMSNTVNAGGMIIYDAHGNGNGSTAPTLTGDHENRVIDYTAIVCCANSSGGDIAGTLDASYYKGVGARSGKDREFVDVVDHSAHRIVRRLTPLECERLQGFPDGWTDIGDYIDGKGKPRKTTDSARYKALGNSIAIPPWTWVLNRLNSCCEEHTMASLFDGIGGFPLIWERLNGKGSCLWSSEIEEFPIAVTRKHFGGKL